MRSMNKYGVILVGGTIGSVVAGGNCSGKGDKENNKSKKIDEIENIKALICECFGIRKENIIFIMVKNGEKTKEKMDCFKKKASESKYVCTFELNNLCIVLINPSENNTLVPNFSKLCNKEEIKSDIQGNFINDLKKGIAVEALDDENNTDPIIGYYKFKSATPDI